MSGRDKATAVYGKREFSVTSIDKGTANQLLSTSIHSHDDQNWLQL